MVAAYLAPVSVVAFAVLIRLPQHGSDSRAGRTTDNRALQAAAKDCAQHSTAGAPDRRTRPRTNAALIAVVPPVPITISLVVVITTVAAVAHSVIELIAPLLPQGRQRSQRQETAG